MTPEERAAKCYREMWEGNGTHSVEFVIAGIARAIREAVEEAAQQSVQRTACTCDVPWLPIGGEGCERCGGFVEASRR